MYFSAEESAVIAYLERNAAAREDLRRLAVSDMSPQQRLIVMAIIVCRDYFDEALPGLERIAAFTSMSAEDVTRETKRQKGRYFDLVDYPQGDLLETVRPAYFTLNPAYFVTGAM